MEKLGVEVEVVDEKEINGIKRIITKQASVSSCSHPANRTVDTGKLTYCRKCEKYLEVKRD